MTHTTESTLPAAQAAARGVETLLERIKELEEENAKLSRHDCEAWHREARCCRTCGGFLGGMQDEILTLTMERHRLKTENGRLRRAVGEGVAEENLRAGAAVLP